MGYLGYVVTWGKGEAPNRALMKPCNPCNFVTSIRISIYSFAQLFPSGQQPDEAYVESRQEKGADDPACRTRRHEAPTPGRQQVRERHRQHEFPGEAHELVQSQARQRPAHPNKHGNQREQLAEEPDIRWDPFQASERRVPAAQKERDAQAANTEHTQVFTEEEERELEPRVLGVVSGNDLRFTFGEIEG